MGYIRVRGSLGNPDGEGLTQVDFLADTGAFFATISREVARKVGIKDTAHTKATLADRREVEMSLSYAYIKIEDREAVLPVAIIDAPEPLLGVTTLEGLGLKVDPTTGIVEKTRSFAIGMLRLAGQLTFSYPLPTSA